jgi:hypothetical protein
MRSNLRLLYTRLQDMRALLRRMASLNVHRLVEDPQKRAVACVYDVTAELPSLHGRYHSVNLSMKFEVC